MTPPILVPERTLYLPQPLYLNSEKSDVFFFLSLSLKNMTGETGHPERRGPSVDALKSRTIVVFCCACVRHRNLEQVRFVRHENAS